MTINCPACNAETEANRFEEGTCSHCRAVFQMKHDCSYDLESNTEYCYDYPVLIRRADAV